MAAQSNIVHELKETPPVPADQVGFKSTSNMLVLNLMNVIFGPELYFRINTALMPYG